MLRKRRLVISKRSIEFALLLTIFISIFFSLEVYLRLKYNGYESNSYKYTVATVHPFLQARLTSEDGTKVNSFGFHSEEISRIKQKGTYRIVLLGGSTVLNRGVPFEKNAAYILERMLAKKFPHIKVEVINAGREGYTSEHSIIQYLFDIKDFEPDMVIMWHGINDLYASCDSSIVTRGKFQRDYGHYFSAISRMTDVYFRQPPLVRIKSYAFDFIVKSLEDNFYSDILIPIRRNSLYKWSRAYSEGKDTVDIENFPSISTYERNLISLVNITADDNVLLLLGNQPSLYKKNSSDEENLLLASPYLSCKQNNNEYSLKSLMNGLKMFNDTTKTVAQQNNVPFIDLASNVPKDKKFFVDSIHFTEEGNTLLAKTIYDFIIIHGYINE